MARKTPNTKSLKLLFARSGNVCAFPNCNHPIFNDNNLYVAELCHIKAANKGGQRYDKMQTDEERSSPNNLIFMCHRHHKETDDTIEYTVDKLLEIKTKHEEKFTEKGIVASKEMIQQVLNDINYFWDLQKLKKFQFEDFRIERNLDKNILDLLNEIDIYYKEIKTYFEMFANSDNSQIMMNEIKELFEDIELDFSKIENIPYYENPLINRNWEIHNIGIPNLLSSFSISFSTLKVKTVEELLKNDPQNQVLKKMLDKFRNEFNSQYEQLYFVD